MDYLDCHEPRLTCSADMSRWLRIPPEEDWDRYSVDQRLEFTWKTNALGRRMIDIGLGRIPSQYGSPSLPPVSSVAPDSQSSHSPSESIPFSKFTSPLLSLPSGHSSPSISSQESATEIATDVSRLLRKDKGFATRFQEWQAQSSNASFGQQDPDMILTQRLCVFYYIELTSFLSNQSCRAEAYQLQEENLRTQNTHLAEDYSVWFPTKYPTYIGDTEKLLRALQENERQSLMERRRHLTRIIAKLETERLAGTALLTRLQPYLPGFDESVLADVHNSSLFPMQSRTSGFQNALLIPPDTVQLQRRSTATRPGLRRCFLGFRQLSNGNAKQQR